MNTDTHRLILTIFFGLFLSVSVYAQSFKIEDYYPLADGNEWRYVAPPGWKDGDYVSRIDLENETVEPNGRSLPRRFLHNDATGAAKILRLGDKKEIYYDGEIFADRSVVLFEKPILWFPAKLKIGDRLNETRSFTRSFWDGKTASGTFKIKQTAVKFETVKTTAGEFKDALRIESETFWDLGDGRKARSVNVYHYAKQVGVVKASARFIIIDAGGKEIINRLVETDLKSYRLNV